MRLTCTGRLACALALTLAPGMGAARANVLLTSDGFGSDDFGYGESQWDNFTAELNSEFTTVRWRSDLSQATDFVGVDAVLLPIRDPGTAPTADELANLAAFIASGKRTLLFGENNLWAGWSSAILGLVGGTYSGYVTTYTNRVVENDLTAGVASLTVYAAGLANGGTALYDVNFATLWPSYPKVLTVLDVDVFGDLDGNAVWESNVAAWLAGDSRPVVPEPGTLALLGLGGLAIVRRRRRA